MSRERTQVMNKSILLVDDSLANLKLTQFLLLEDGFEVRIAENAEQALQALERSVPDIILMDIQMPGMDGLALTRHLRRDWDSSLRNVPIVALTASAIKGDDQIARAAGCDGYITKPIDTRTFVSMVREYAGARFVGTPSAGTVPGSARGAGAQSCSKASSMLFKQTSSR
jgi:two-component system, cell cycle response regulator DivK